MITLLKAMSDNKFAMLMRVLSFLPMCAYGSLRGESELEGSQRASWDTRRHLHTSLESELLREIDARCELLHEWLSHG